MLQFNENPNYIYYAFSMKNEKLLGELSLTGSTANDIHSYVSLTVPSQELTIEEKEILLQDMLEFLFKSEEVTN